MLDIFPDASTNGLVEVRSADLGRQVVTAVGRGVHRQLDREFARALDRDGRNDDDMPGRHRSAATLAG